ncbi:hypothetical protein KBD87_03190 [Candidatus Saccharibacteria bacterium]|nr:hypothetical protein [Candidatus Saccharibacteria bacterium]
MNIFLVFIMAAVAVYWISLDKPLDLPVGWALWRIEHNGSESEILVGLNEFETNRNYAVITPQILGEVQRWHPDAKVGDRIVLLNWRIVGRLAPA